MKTLPGFSAPAAGFDEPLALLDACHARVRRSLDLLARLAARVAQDRVDTTVHDAARDVLRYFDIAAPHHHEDEERHVFPLVAHDSPALQAAVRALRDEHDEMRRRWAALREPLAALAGGDAQAFGDAAQHEAQAFAALYERHAALEEALVFPAAQRLADADAQRAMGREMAQRRGAPGPLA